MESRIDSAVASLATTDGVLTRRHWLWYPVVFRPARAGGGCQMKLADVKIGECYMTRVSGVLRVVVVKNAEIPPRGVGTGYRFQRVTRFACRVVRTGNTIKRTAAALRPVNVIHVDKKSGEAIQERRSVLEPDIPVETVDLPRCESGWTGDRCTFPLGHEGPHSNHKIEEA